MNDIDDIESLIEEIINSVAKNHQIVLHPDDPLLILPTILGIISQYYLTKQQEYLENWQSEFLSLVKKCESDWNNQSRKVASQMLSDAINTVNAKMNQDSNYDSLIRILEINVKENKKTIKLFKILLIFLVLLFFVFIILFVIFFSMLKNFL